VSGDAVPLSAQQHLLQEYAAPGQITG
jgi:hypothetical protein